jgi:chromosomal replication initiator protein
MTAYVQHPAKWVTLIEPKNLDPEEIIQLICNFYSIPVYRLESSTRKREVVIARQMAVFMLRYYTGLSFKAIGRRFGQRDHTTAIHSIKTINDLCETDPIILKNRNDIHDQITKCL